WRCYDKPSDLGRLPMLLPFGKPIFRKNFAARDLGRRHLIVDREYPLCSFLEVGFVGTRRKDTGDRYSVAGFLTQQVGLDAVCFDKVKYGFGGRNGLKRN